MGIIGNQYREGFIFTAGSATKTSHYHKFSQSGGNLHLVNGVKINLPGITSTSNIIISDGSGTGAVQKTGSIPILSQPDQGFKWGDKMDAGLAIGSEGITIDLYGNSVNGRSGAVYIDYKY